MSDPRGRVHPRFAVDWRVELRCPDWGVVSRACASNASRGGIFILTSRPPAVGAPVEVVLSLPDGSKVELRGTVQHVVTPERAVAEGKSAGIGVRLHDRHAVDLLVLEHMAEAAEGTVDVAMDDLSEPPAPPPSPAPGSQPLRPVVGKINLVPSVPPARVVGIDFGSTVTRLAFVAGERVQVAAAVPSVVTFPHEGPALVGRAAIDGAPEDPRRTVAMVKRLLGRSFAEPHITDLLRAAPFATVEAGDGGIDLDLGHSRRPLSDVASLILETVREQAEKQLRRGIGEAVVAIPADLGDTERAVLRAAAGRAGLEVAAFIDEPIAAALACGAGRGGDGIIAVADLGGGGFAVSLLEVTGERLRLVARAADEWTSGDDYDVALAQTAADQLWRRTRVEVREDPRAWSRLVAACERAKRALAAEPSAVIAVDKIAAGVDLRQRVTREAFAIVTRDLVGRAAEVARRALELAGVTPAGLDRVLLVGGGARLAPAREALAEVLGPDRELPVAADEAVALGAAMRAASRIA